MQSETEIRCEAYKRALRNVVALIDGWITLDRSEYQHTPKGFFGRLTRRHHDLNGRIAAMTKLQEILQSEIKATTPRTWEYQASVVQSVSTYSSSWAGLPLGRSEVPQ